MNVRAWMAAVSAAAYGGFAPPVPAAAIEGSLNFPGGFLPAMTIYVRDLDGTRLHSVTTREAQSAFKLELPPGRYTFFAEPRQAGAPQIYGAFTQAVACRQQDEHAACEDHSLVVVTVGAGGVAPGDNHEPAAPPMISDWSVPDELAAEFDQLLGHRTEPSVQELGAPRFSEYPAHADIAAAPPFNFALLGAAAERQQHIREALSAAPAFAGSVAVAQLSCGADCVEVILADWKSGKLQAPPALAQVPRNLPCRGDETILYRRDSRLLSLTRRRDADVVTQYFLWKPDSGTLVQTAEYQRPVERFCSLQNP